MGRVIGIGETVLDVLFKNGQPVKAVPGGSVYNSMISLGRMGADVSFISEVGDDKVAPFGIAIQMSELLDGEAIVLKGGYSGNPCSFKKGSVTE